jgi:hypothetical protein
MSAFRAFPTSDDARGNRDLRKETETGQDFPLSQDRETALALVRVAPNGSVRRDKLRPPNATPPDTVRGRHMVKQDRRAVARAHAPVRSAGPF